MTRQICPKCGKVKPPEAPTDAWWDEHNRGHQRSKRAVTPESRDARERRIVGPAR